MQTSDTHNDSKLSSCVVVFFCLFFSIFNLFLSELFFLFSFKMCTTKNATRYHLSCRAQWRRCNRIFNCVGVWTVCLLLLFFFPPNKATEQCNNIRTSSCANARDNSRGVSPRFGAKNYLIVIQIASDQTTILVFHSIACWFLSRCSFFSFNNNIVSSFQWHCHLFPF